MEWVFVMFMNGWMIDVDRFGTHTACEDKVRMYRAAGDQAGGQFKVWCEQRPIRNVKAINATTV